MRKVIHVDMDAFYASVEQRDNPELRGKPVAVGSSRKRGVVSTASYEARKYGVRSALPSLTAKRLCPDLIFVPPRFDVYKEVSLQIREIFREYSELVEPLSLDEAYIDVTENKMNMQSATEIAMQIKQKIYKKTSLTASAGVSFNKFLAKVASDINKPDGIYVITPDMADKFIRQLPVKKFFGVGNATAEKMNKMGIFTGEDLKKFSEFEMIKKFGKMGKYYFDITNCIDEREVRPHRIRKSIGAERTYIEDLQSKHEFIEKIIELCDIEYNRISKNKSKGFTLTLKIKYSDFTRKNRSYTSNYPITTLSDLQEIALNLLHIPNLPDKPVRLFGLTLSKLETNSPEDKQTKLKL